MTIRPPTAVKGSFEATLRPDQRPNETTRWVVCCACSKLGGKHVPFSNMLAQHMVVKHINDMKGPRRLHL